MFKLISNFKPRGDQPQAISKLVDGLNQNLQHQVLLGITGSGKTFTMASVIEKVGLPTLVISPNKTLAAQLYREFKGFLPHNSIHYFVSYYDYYQPEAYLPATETYIAKDARINSDIDKLRHAAIQAVLSRRDIVVVSSVSCLYGIGDPNEYQRISLHIKEGQHISKNDVARHLAFLRYERTNDLPERAGLYRLDKDKIRLQLVTGENVEIAFEKRGIVRLMDISTGKNMKELSVFPVKFWITPQQRLKIAMQNIRSELERRLEELQSANKFEEAERLERRVSFDLERLEKDGYMNGIENYSRHLSFREPGEPPVTILDYFSKPFLILVDESHIAVPQLGGMYEGDRRRKQTLVDYGFRLPSALDNRPLRFDEFTRKINQAIYVSATPGDYEMNLAKKSGRIVEQIIRPTGVLDPAIVIKPAKTQVRNLIAEIKKRCKKNERVLALTLTKRQAEDLADYLLARGIKAVYLHSEIKTLERPEIIRQLRSGEVDVIVGINLLREGLDLPEVTLVAILDADREGFLRNHRSIIQMAGRAARSTNGRVILYADKITGSIRNALAETDRRRKIQIAFNKKHNVEPLTIMKPVSSATLMEIAGLNLPQEKVDASYKDV